MNEALKNEKSIRQFLLERVSGGTSFQEFAELRSNDTDFAVRVERIEDSLVDDFVYDRLDARDRTDFAASLGHSRTRSEKVKLAKALREKANEGADDEREPAEAFLDAVKAFFRKPLNSAAFALALIGIIALFYFLPAPSFTDDLARLREIYAKERPTESRLDAFNYAPPVTTRGAAEEVEKTRLQRIELELVEAAEKRPTAARHHSLGVFYLTQRRSREAIAALEKAVLLNEKNAAFRNDLGAAFFEHAKSFEFGDRLMLLDTANRSFAKAVELDPDFLPARFNLALCLQNLDLKIEARRAWKAYLERDGKTGWAEEARRNLARMGES